MRLIHQFLKECWISVVVPIVLATIFLIFVPFCFGADKAPKDVYLGTGKCFTSNWYVTTIWFENNAGIWILNLKSDVDQGYDFTCTKEELRAVLKSWSSALGAKQETFSHIFIVKSKQDKVSAECLWYWLRNPIFNNSPQIVNHP